MQHYKGIMYFLGSNSRWYVNHPEAYCGGFKTEKLAKEFIDHRQDKEQQ